MPMQKGRTLDKYSPESLQECLDIPYKSIQLAAELFMTGEEFTVAKLADSMGSSRTSAKTQIDYLMGRNLIHLHRWDKTHAHNWTAVFKAGNNPHAINPGLKNVIEVKPPPPPPEPEPIAEPLPKTYFQDLARALVPVRDEQGRREVNWRYIKYIAGEAA